MSVLLLAILKFASVELNKTIIHRIKLQFVPSSKSTRGGKSCLRLVTCSDLDISPTSTSFN